MFFPIVIIVIGLVLIWLGIFRIRKPDFGFHFNESWKYKEDVEPSEYYLMLEKLGGIAIIIMGSFFVLFGIMRLLQEILTT